VSTSIIDREPTDLEAAEDRAAPPALRVPADVRLRVDPDDFERLCSLNRDLRLELKADGTLIVMTPASSESSEQNAELTAQLRNWNKAAKLGAVFDSSGGFTLPDGSVLAPDASWILRDRWRGLDPEARRGFARIVPDFIAELRSASDSLPKAREKMRDYLAQGVRLGWLIDPKTRTVEIYRSGRDVETLTNPATLSGEDVLPGFTLDLAGILHDEV